MQLCFWCSWNVECREKHRVVNTQRHETGLPEKGESPKKEFTIGVIGESPQFQWESERLGRTNGICTEYMATMPSSESGKGLDLGEAETVAQAEGTKQVEGQRENLEDKESWKQTLEF